MEYGICDLSVVAIRAEAKDSAEQTSQLLFGESFDVIDKTKTWRKVRCHHDGYEGWLDVKNYSPLTFDECQQIKNNEIIISLDLVQVMVEEGRMFPIVIGSNLPFFDNKQCVIGGRTYSFQGFYREKKPKTPSKMQLTEHAFNYLNAPYLWGGRSPFGIDCSGLTQMVYKLSGFDLPRDAYQQAETGHTLSLLEEAEPGDLIFFDNEDGKITHVGILLQDRRIIHASGRVRVDRLDHFGIYNEEQGKYTHKLRLIKQYF